jgi:uncharacterized heparinase superfamily protein
MNLLPEMMEAGLWQMASPLRVGFRRNWFYRRLLKGPLSDHIAFQPHDACVGRLEDADALLRGRFRFCGEVVDVAAGVSVFDLPPPSRAWMEELHSFSWLAPLAAAGGEAARTLATNLIAQWIKRYGRYGEPQWLPHVLGRRLMHIFSHGRLVVLNSDMMWLQTVRELARAGEDVRAHRRRSARRLAAPGSGRGAGAIRPLPA